MATMKKLLLYAMVLVSGVFRSYGMNLLSPYNTLIRPAYSNDYRFQVSFYAQAGISNKAFNADSCSANALRILNCDQDALAMLDGFASDSSIGQKRTEIDANDDGTRGHFLVEGDLKTRFAAALGFRTFFKKHWAISAYLPFYAMELDGVCWNNQTKNVSDEDARVRSLLTDNFFANVCSLGDGLQLGGWKRAGIGDVSILGEWFRDFPQAKPLLKNVRVNLRAGMILPTGLRQDEDKLMAIPFGTDGALGVPFGVGLDLHFAFYMRAGFDVQLTHCFGDTRARRIKTDQNQTDLLLLQKMDVYKDFGLTQQFNLYGQIYHLIKGVSFLFGYQFLKHGADEISLCSNATFSNATANSAEYLKERVIHQVFFRADYDIGSNFGDHPRVYPRVSLFAQLPFKGKRVALTSFLGLTMSLDF